MAKADCIIRQGHVYDPANNINGEITDVAIKDGIIYEIGNNLIHTSLNEIDARGCIVCPGLIDGHIHGYQHATPLGVNVDEACLSRGVTTVCDAGSAGAGNFMGLKKFIIEKSKTRVYAFLHIAAHGLSAAGCAGFGNGGECDSLNQVNVDLCTNCVEKNRDTIVGIKLRLAADVCNDGKNEQEAYKRALSASKVLSVPLMTHHAITSVPRKSDDPNILSCPGSLRKGDIYTHMMHGYPGVMIDDKRQVDSSALEARKRGVYFDLGHGQGSFSWTVAEICAASKFWPDIISTDLHNESVDGPAYDLPTVMSKLYHLGMPLDGIIKAVTLTPAKAIHKEHEIGSLGVGRCADVTILKEVPVDLQLEDSQGQMRNLNKLLVPKFVFRGGKQYDIIKPSVFPNVAKYAMLAKPWHRLHVKDDHAPCH